MSLLRADIKSPGQLGGQEADDYARNQKTVDQDRKQKTRSGVRRTWGGVADLVWETWGPQQSHHTLRHSPHPAAGSIGYSWWQQRVEAGGHPC